jgi:4-hydroxybenzoate polyprenyltransferase
LKLKSTIFSPLPYIISFGALPWAIFLAAGTTSPLWLYLALALFTTAFHFLNVVKDLQWDLEQGVLGLPQRMGKNWSVLTASILAMTGLFVLLFLR